MRRRTIEVLSLAATPLLLLSSAHELYLRNQEELDRALVVLVPFWQGFVALALFGVLLLRLQPSPLARRLLWVYYLLGPAFLVYQFLWNLEAEAHLARWLLDRPSAVALLAAAFVAAALGLSSRWLPRDAAAPLAVFSLALLVGEGARFAGRAHVVPAAAPARAARPLPPGDPRLGNVYHLILDAYQAELFAAASSSRTAAAFDGFVRYPGARSLAAGTVDSMPMVLTGRRNAPAGGDHLQAALRSDASLPATLRQAGYRTVAFLPPRLYPSDLPVFDRVVLHDENLGGVRVERWHAAMFWRLWLFSVLPPTAVHPLARLGVLPAPGRRLSTYVQPVLSHLAVRRILRDEAALPPAGRYTLIHLLLPHSPFLLDGDCAIRDPAHPTDPLAQTRCATLVVARLVERLKELDRFDSSTIVVHGDHGMGLRLDAGGLVEDPTVHSHTLLLIKPAFGRGPLRVSTEEASLLDVAPTLLAGLGLAAPEDAEGHVLADALPSASARSAAAPARARAGARQAGS